MRTKSCGTCACATASRTRVSSSRLARRRCKHPCAARHGAPRLQVHRAPRVVVPGRGQRELRRVQRVDARAQRALLRRPQTASAARKRRSAAAAARAWVCTVTSVLVYSSPFDHRSATSEAVAKVRRRRARRTSNASNTACSRVLSSRSTCATRRGVQRDAAPRQHAHGERAPCRAAFRQRMATRPDTRGRAARGACIPPAWPPCAAARGPAARVAPPLRSSSWRQHRSTSTRLPQRACQQAAVNEHGVTRHVEPRRRRGE